MVIIWLAKEELVSAVVMETDVKVLCVCVCVSGERLFMPSYFLREY